MNVELPKPEDVGVFYNRFTSLFEILWGDSLHFGYWPDQSSGGTIEEGQERLTDLMASRVEVGADQHFLDVGCGTGRASIKLARQKGCRLTGINVSSSQVEAANRRAAQAGLSGRVTFEVADAMAMPFADHSYDGAWAFESMLHMPRLADAAAEVRRVLKPGARFVISDVVAINPMSAEDDEYYRSIYPVAPLLSPAEYVRTLRAAGFEIEETKDITSQVAKTLLLTVENIQSARTRIEEAYGSDFLPVLSSSWGKAINIHLKSLGYMIFVARGDRRHE